MHPAGIGWLPQAQDLRALSRAARSQIKAQVQQMRSLAAPQFELSRQALSNPDDRQPPQGFGPIARWWSPRRDWQGTFDDHWRTYRYPEWPSDFDALFYNSAHPELMAPNHLRGDDEIALANCVNEGAVREGDNWNLRLKRAIIGDIGLDLLAEVKASRARSAGAAQTTPQAATP